MRRKSRIVGGSCFVAVVAAAATLAGTALSGSRGVGPERSSSDSGVAGPLGPNAFSAFPAYFKRVTFSQNQLGQYQEIAIHLPAGRYLVEVLTSHAPTGSRPDCAGVSFPLVPSVVEGRSFTGYVPVAHDGDAATVSCYERATGPDASATYRLFYLPVSPKAGAATPEEP